MNKLPHFMHHKKVGILFQYFYHCVYWEVLIHLQFTHGSYILHRKITFHIHNQYIFFIINGALKYLINGRFINENYG